MKQNENDNKLSFEITIKLNLKDYRIRFATKRAIIIGTILMLIKVGLLFVHRASG